MTRRRDERRRRPGPIERRNGQRRRLRAGEIHMLMTVLSGNPPAEDRKKAAARLGNLLSAKAGRPSGDYIEYTQILKAWILENLVKERVAEMRRNGERPEGGRRTQALDEIAREYANNIDAKSLLRALARGRRLRRLLAERKRRASEH